MYDSGVTMYTMLTGCLPYTVDSPLKSAALLKMILENAMNPIPEHLSSGKYCHNTRLVQNTMK